MEEFYEKIAYLEHTIQDKDEKLEKLESSINNANIVLKDITVILEFTGLSKEQIDLIDNIEIEKAIKEKYASSLGKEVKSLDADILVQVIDKRILRFDDTEYQLTVNKLVLSDILKLWVGVSLLEVTSP
jgi:predicted mannosyl-3-phosphoglycerate phosphatase (HAD superfamily)